MSELGKAIEHFRYGVDCDIFHEPVRTYAKLALVALREKAERDKYCKDCKCPRCASGYWRVREDI